MTLREAVARVVSQLSSSTDVLTAGCLAELRNALAADAERSQRDIAMHDALCEAVKYVLDRAQTDPDLGYYLGPGMQAFFLLCKAEAAYLGRPLAEVEAQRKRSLIPDHRRKEPMVEMLRRELDEARGGGAERVQ